MRITATLESVLRGTPSCQNMHFSNAPRSKMAQKQTDSERIRQLLEDVSTPESTPERDPYSDDGEYGSDREFQPNYDDMLSSDVESTETRKLARNMMRTEFSGSSDTLVSDDEVEMLTSIALVVLVLVSVYAYFWWNNPARRSFSKLPSFLNVPVLGSFFSLCGDGQHMYNVLVKVTAISEEKRLPFVVWMGPVPVIVLQNLDDIKAVSNNFIEKPYFYSFAKSWIGNGLVTAPGYIWKRNIKKLAGAFTGNIVDGFQDVFNSQAKKLVDCLKTEAGKEPFDVMQKYLAETTLEAICQTALGVPKISNSIITHEYYMAFARTIELILRRGVNIFKHLDFIFCLTQAKKEMDKCIEVIQNVYETVMKRRQEEDEFKNTEMICDIKTETEKCKFKSYMDIILELNAKDPTFTAQQVRDEINTIILAGQETVASALCYMLLMIGCKPAVQDKLHIEIKAIFGDSKRDVTKEDLARMTFCEAVINETLRLFPPAPVVIRYADRDLQLESCLIPKGTACVLNFYGVGRSKHYWGADVLEFRPERWLSGSASSSALLAFSAGKRSCIGKKYAMSIMKTVIAHCVRELVLISEADKMKLKVDLMLRPAGFHLLQVGLRNALDH